MIIFYSAELFRNCRRNILLLKDSKAIPSL